MSSTPSSLTFRQYVRTVQDWPAPGVQFRDISPLLQNPAAFRAVVDCFVQRYQAPALHPDLVAGLDGRGFVLGAAIAYALQLGFVSVSKKTKLPYHSTEFTYQFAYGSATMAVHSDAVQAGQRVLLVGDLIATGSTMMAGKGVLEKLGAQVIEGAAIVNLPELGGSQRLLDSGLPIFTLADFEGH